MKYLSPEQVAQRIAESRRKVDVATEARVLVALLLEPEQLAIADAWGTCIDDFQHPGHRGLFTAFRNVQTKTFAHPSIEALLDELEAEDKMRGTTDRMRTGGLLLIELMQTTKAYEPHEYFEGDLRVLRNIADARKAMALSA